MAAEQTVRIDGTSVVNIGTVTGTVRTTEYASTTSLSAAGSVTAPTAGTAICTLTTPAAGFYRVDVHRISGGTGTPVLFNNAELRIGAAPRTLSSSPAINIPYTYTFFIGLNGSQSLSINATATEAADVTYAATLVATRMN